MEDVCAPFNITTMHAPRSSQLTSILPIYLHVFSRPNNIEHQRQAKEAAALKLHMPMALRFSIMEIDRTIFHHDRGKMKYKDSTGKLPSSCKLFNRRQNYIRLIHVKLNFSNDSRL